MIQTLTSRSLVGSWVVGLLLLFSARLDAQELYQRGPVMKLSKIGVVDQLVGGRSTERAADAGTAAEQPAARQVQSSLRPKSENPPTDFTWQAKYESISPQQQDWDQILNAASLSGQETLVTNDDSKSFIEREKTGTSGSRGNARDMIAKLSINLAFVLAIAFGFILLAKQWQKSKLPPQVKPSADRDILKVSQVLPLTHGASLHVVEGLQNKCLVAIDAGGIKSVHLLTPSFEQTLEQAEMQQDAPEDAPEIRLHEPVVADESTTEIDERLIKLLLQNSKQAA